MHNVYQYCIKQRRYKVFTVCAFYVLSTMVVICRMTQFSYMAYDSNSSDTRPTMAIWASYATYSKVSIGWLVCLSMVELSIGLTALKVTSF